jgi:hypothetical protein
LEDNRHQYEVGFVHISKSWNLPTAGGNLGAKTTFVFALFYLFIWRNIMRKDTTEIIQRITNAAKYYKENVESRIFNDN